MNHLWRIVLLGALMYGLGGCVIAAFPPRDAPVVIDKGSCGDNITAQSQERTCISLFLKKDPKGIVCQRASSGRSPRFITWTSSDDFALDFGADHPFANTATGACDLATMNQRKHCQVNTDTDVRAADKILYKYKVDFGLGCTKDPYVFLRR